MRQKWVDGGEKFIENVEDSIYKIYFTQFIFSQSQSSLPMYYF